MDHEPHELGYAGEAPYAVVDTQLPEGAHDEQQRARHEGAVARHELARHLAPREVEAQEQRREVGGRHEHDVHRLNRRCPHAPSRARAVARVPSVAVWPSPRLPSVLSLAKRVPLPSGPLAFRPARRRKEAAPGTSPLRGAPRAASMRAYQIRNDASRLGVVPRALGALGAGHVKSIKYDFSLI